MCILNIVSAVLVKPCLEKKQDKSLKRVGEGGMKQLLCKEGWKSRPVQLGKECCIGPGGASQLCIVVCGRQRLIRK